MIIKQSVVDVLMFLFERYLDDDDSNKTGHVTDKRDSIQLRLEEMGFHNQDINQAFDWLEEAVAALDEVVDQAALIGVINALYNMGHTVVLVERLHPDTGPRPAETKEEA